MDQPVGRYLFLRPPATHARGGLTRHVTTALREAIVNLSLRPGEVLDKPAICERLGVSRSPVSEALARLQAEGLVEIAPQRGTAVSLVRIADVIEAMLIRKALESEAVRIAAERRPARLIESLEANLDGQANAVDSGDREGFHALDLDFHEVLSGGLGYPRLTATIDSTRANLDRARLLIITPRRHAHSLGEHRAILTGVAAGNPPAAVAAMRAHVDSVMAELLAFARTHPGLFADGAAADTAETAAFPFG